MGRGLVCFGMIACLAATACAQEAAKPSAETAAAMQLARKTLERFRDDVHKEKMLVVWPEVDEIDIPTEVDVLRVVASNWLVTCARIELRKDGARCYRVQHDLLRGQGGIVETWRKDVKLADVQQALRAMALVLAAKVERKPTTPPPEENLGYGGPLGMARRIVWVAAPPGAPPKYRSIFSGVCALGDIQDFEHLRKQTVDHLFDGVVNMPSPSPAYPGIIREAPRGTTETSRLRLEKDWGAFLTRVVGRLTTEIDPTRLYGGVTHEQLQLMTVSVRLLGESGYAASAATLRSARQKLSRWAKEGPSPEKTLHDLTRGALLRLSLLEKFDATAAAKILDDNRALRDDPLLERWVRQRWCTVDAQGYRLALLKDISTPTVDIERYRRSVDELVRRYPQRVHADLAGYVMSKHPEVSVKAALAILKVNPADTPALGVVERIASDVSTPIAADARGYGEFARAQAVAFMTSEQAPILRRWDTFRVRRQVLDEKDGRMIRTLFLCLVRLGGRPMRAERIRAYRRALKAPMSRGVVEAIDQLIRLRDYDSATTLKIRLMDLESGCAPAGRRTPAKTPKYSWVKSDEVERLWERLEVWRRPD